MNFQKENHEIVRQNDTIVKKSQKHDANLQKNTTLYFQIGLMLTLLAVYGLFEMKFESKPIDLSFNEEIQDDLSMIDVPVIVIKDDVKKVQQKVKKRKIFKHPIIKDNDEVIDKPEDLFVEPPTVNTPPIKVDDVPDVIDIIDEVSIIAVEQVPVYPGCEGLSTNFDRRACMEQKLAKLIDRKFDREIASNYGLSGVQKIYVQFKIDKLGNVVDIKTRAPHKALAKEAEKVINKVPQMQPGKQAQKPVNVIYSLPIIFQVQD